MTDSNFAVFNGTQIPLIQHNNDAWFSTLDIGKCLNYDDPQKGIHNLYSRRKDELDEHSVTLKLRATDGKKYATRVYNEEGVMMISMLSKQPLAKQFRRWAIKILKAYRHGQLTSIVPKGNTLVDKDEYIDLLQAKNALLEYKLQPKWRPILEEEAKQMLALQRQGLGVTAIAQQMDRSTSGVRAALNRVTQH